MIHNFLKNLCTELSSPSLSELNKEQMFFVQFNPDIQIAFTDLSPGVAIRGKIIACPKQKLESLYIYLMRANLFGQGTGGARIGFNEEKQELTLSLGVLYEINYSTFKNLLEGFINHLIYWRNEVLQWEKSESIV